MRSRSPSPSPSPLDHRPAANDVVVDGGRRSGEMCGCDGGGGKGQQRARRALGEAGGGALGGVGGAGRGRSTVEAASLGVES